MSNLVQSANFVVPLYGIQSTLITTSSVPVNSFELSTRNYVDSSTVANIVALKALPNNGTLVASTRGYYAADDGGGGTYHIDTADTTSADNGGSVIVATDGGRWKLVQGGTVNARQWGVVGDGVTDDTARLQAALNSLGTKGGVVQVPNGRLHIASNLTVPASCDLVGPHGSVGICRTQGSSPYETVGGTLLLEPTATIYVGASASLRGFMIYRYGMTFPAPDTSAYAGTAVTCVGDDCLVQACMIMGFIQAVYSDYKSRMKFYDLNIDCLNGVYISRCYDISRVENVHCWPWATMGSGVPSSKFLRSGIAFCFRVANDWGKVTNCFSYGYAIGFSVEASCMVFTSCGADSVVNQNTVGFSVTAGGQNVFTACQGAAHGTSFYFNNGAGNQSRLVNCSMWTMGTQAISIDSGDVYVSECFLRTVPYGITINNSASQVVVSDTRFNLISSRPINLLVPSTNIIIDDTNDFGNWSGASPINSGSAGAWTPPTLASAEPLNLLPSFSFFVISGTNSITTLNSGWPGRKVTLKFTGYLTLVKGASMGLSQNMYTSPGDTITLVHDGTAWSEVCRSALVSEPTTLDSAEPLALPNTGSVFVINGVVGFATLNGGWAGRKVTLEFKAALTVSDGASMKLAGNFVTTADDTLTLVHDGTSWVEVCRSVN